VALPAAGGPSSSTAGHERGADAGLAGGGGALMALRVSSESHMRSVSAAACSEGVSTAAGRAQSKSGRSAGSGCSVPARTACACAASRCGAAGAGVV
jgi:hypothetical protein